VKLGKNHKLRRKRRALAGIVDRLGNSTNKRQRGHRSRVPPDQLGDSIQEFMAKANVSRATVWRMMKSGELRFIRLSERIRRIPTSEYRRLGLIPDIEDTVEEGEAA
jgi:hypothetical protein